MSSLCVAVPSFLSGHVFCISSNGSRNSEIFEDVHSNTKVFFTHLTKYPGKADFRKGNWNPERNLGGKNTYFFQR